MLRLCIAFEKTDAIVHQTNQFLKVDPRLQRYAGLDAPIQAECNQWIKDNGLFESGKLVVTESGDLKCKHIIHTLGVVIVDEEDDNSVQFVDCIESILEKANELKIESISFPPISCGGAGFKADLCAELMISTCVRWLKQNHDDTKLKEIRLCVSDGDTELYFIDKLYELYRKDYN